MSQFHSNCSPMPKEELVQKLPLTTNFSHIAEHIHWVDQVSGAYCGAHYGDYSWIIVQDDPGIGKGWLGECVMCQ